MSEYAMPSGYERPRRTMRPRQERPVQERPVQVDEPPRFEFTVRRSFVPSRLYRDRFGGVPGQYEQEQMRKHERAVVVIAATEAEARSLVGAAIGEPPPVPQVEMRDYSREESPVGRFVITVDESVRQVSP